jgi:hypothetical protein
MPENSKIDQNRELYAKPARRQVSFVVFAPQAGARAAALKIFEATEGAGLYQLKYPL